MADRLAILDQLFDPADLRERRCHRTDTPGADLSSMSRQFHTLAQAAAAHVHDHLEAFGNRSNPLLGQSHTLFGRQHVALARGAVDEDAFQTVLVQHRSIRRDGFEIHISVPVKRRERGIDQSFDFFHIKKRFEIV